MALPGTSEARETARAADKAALEAWREFMRLVASQPEYPSNLRLSDLSNTLDEVRSQRAKAQRVWDEVHFMEET